MRIIVTGGRDYCDFEVVMNELNALLPSLGTIVHGGARGADSLAEEWCQAAGVVSEVHPADWQVHGRPAGMIRNREMAKLGADLCLAFPGGKGTLGMINEARKAGIPVRFVK